MNRFKDFKPERSSQIMTHAPLQAQELMRQDRVEEFFGLQVETQGVITGEKDICASRLLSS